MRRSQEELTKLYEKCLDGDYVICDKCDGTGEEISDNLKATYHYPCDKCWGTGILDWIERIIGKECPYTDTDSNSSSSSSSSSTLKSSNIVPYTKKKRTPTIRKQGEKNEHNNFIRSRTVQRLYQMSNKLKGCMQRRRHTKRVH